MLVLLGGATNSCISALVEEEQKQEEPVEPEEPEVPEEPEEPEVPTKDGEKWYVLQIALNYVDGDTPWVLDWSNYKSVGYLLKDDQGNTVYANKELIIEKEAGYENVLMVDSVKTETTNGQGYAYAPYNATLSGTVLTGNLNATQNQQVNSNKTMDNTLKSNMLLTADQTTFRFDQGTCLLSLRSVFSVIQLTIEDLAAILPLRSIQNVTLYIANQNDIRIPINSTPLSGSFSIDLANNTAGTQFYNPAYAITANVTANTFAQISNNPVVFFIVNPFTLKPNETLAARVVTSWNDEIYSSFAISTARNRIYALKASATVDNTYVESTDDRYLSTYSNCYVVSQKGKYIFPADKTMNGRVFTGVNGAKVEWLWASKEGEGSFNINELIDPSSLSYNGTTITFQVGDKNPFSTMKKGNVILALKNANNEIVWTWHIWITDDLKDYSHENKWFLDRNIGALSAQVGSSPINNFGFVYQWGRKDPFFGGDGRASETTAMSIARMNTIVNNSDWPTPANYTIDTLTAAKYPMTFYCNPSTSTDFKTPVDWSSNSSTPRWSESYKTDHDPCPQIDNVRYRVPNKAELAVLYHVGYSVFKNQSPLFWEYTYQTNTTIWPAAGMRQGRGNNGGRLLYAGTTAVTGQCFYWSGSPFVLPDNSVLPDGAYRIYTSGEKLYAEEFGDKADAYPVRCIRME